MCYITGGTSLWEGSNQPKPGGNWTPKSSWPNENGPSTGSNAWGHGPPGASGPNSGWSDNSSNQWNSRKPWEETNGDFRDRRQFVSI